ncbi:hypothetical protein WICPIJ_010114 [Wickerhamomyces pijperi]|uniref:Uncharacterized protein n=1 Tax=Wickerhamomyces pijperi TaxID=599730 RepID=A0A9P8PIU9_WICPI|nr:hypothetical protein WICPIJ_010114 [Wickerhamomyces pijperi]
MEAGWCSPAHCCSASSSSTSPSSSSSSSYSNSSALLMDKVGLTTAWSKVQEARAFSASMMICLEASYPSLDRTFNVTDGLYGQSVLVVTVNELVLQFTNLVDEDTQLVGDIGHVVVIVFTPNGQLLSNFSSFVGDNLDTSQHVLLDLDQLGKLSG